MVPWNVCRPPALMPGRQKVSQTCHSIIAVPPARDAPRPPAVPHGLTLRRTRHGVPGTNQIWPIRYTITAIASPTTPSTTVLHLLRSISAQKPPATGSSSAEIR